MNSTIWGANKEIDLLLISKKLEENREYHSDKMATLKILFIVGLILSFIMYMLVLYDVNDFKEKYIFIFLGLILIIVLVSLLVMLKGLT